MFYGRDVILADREMVESASDDILSGADNSDVAFLVVGDPFGYAAHLLAFHSSAAYTHFPLLFPAKSHPLTFS